MIYGENIEDLASNWCLIAPSRLNLWYLMDINRTGDLFGAHNAGEIPVTIPNTEVKPSRADYTALRETRKVPNYKKPSRKVGFFVLTN